MRIHSPVVVFSAAVCLASTFAATTAQAGNANRFGPTFRVDTATRRDTTARRDSAAKKDSLTRKDSTARKDTSAIRIKISKGGVPHEDTVFIRSRDTVKVPQLRVDTVTRTVHRVDTMTVRLPPPVTPLRLPTGFYLGVAGGGAAPWGSLYNPNNAGPSAQAQLGWQSVDSPFGFRVDANYLRPAEDAGYAALGQGLQSDFVNISPDLKVRLPFLTHMFGASPQFSLYGIGGATFAAYKNARIEMQPGFAGFGSANAGFAPGWQHSWGWNAGGGASLLVRSVEIFAESRMIAFTPTNANQSQIVPFVLGINWFGSVARR